MNPIVGLSMAPSRNFTKLFIGILSCAEQLKSCSAKITHNGCFSGWAPDEVSGFCLVAKLYEKCISLNARITLRRSSWEVSLSAAKADSCLPSHSEHMLIVWKGEQKYSRYLCCSLSLPLSRPLSHVLLPIPDLRSQNRIHMSYRHSVSLYSIVRLRKDGIGLTWLFLQSWKLRELLSSDPNCSSIQFPSNPQNALVKG